MHFMLEERDRTMAWKKNEAQPQPREGAKFTPKHPETATRKEELNEIRSQQDIGSFERGPTHHTSNPSG